MILHLITDLKNIESCSFNTNWKFTVNTNPNQKNIECPISQKYDIYLNFYLKLDPTTRFFIFNRIIFLLEDVIQIENFNESIKSEILDNYFKDIADTIRNILTRDDNIKNENNISEKCELCLIF